MQAIILAAGMGKRLKELTAGNTKCMVKVNGITLAERALRILDKKNLSKIVIVVGYEGQKLIDYIETLGIKTPIVFIDNPIYYKTNNIYSLALAEDYLVSEDSLLLESDLIFGEDVIDLLLDDDRETLALVDKFESWMDGTCMVLDSDDSILDFIPGKHLKFSETENYYKTVNIYKFSKHFCENTYVPFLRAYAKAMGDNEYYESVIKLIAMLETKEIRAKRLNGQVWYEIDDIQDLNIAETLFPVSDEQKVALMAKRYGGYWRYPKLIDFCYLVNPYYPSEKMKEEIKSNFDTLLTQYPSGMDINSLLAAKYFSVKQSQIAVGNGAAELIHELMNHIEGAVGFIRPTFEEYPNRYNKDNSIIMQVSGPDFSYSAQDIIDFFGKEKTASGQYAKYIVLINPDNPSGNLLTYDEVITLLDWCKATDRKLIFDESFLDFAGEERFTLLSSETLEKYASELYVVKSISKSFGVPGLRLGVLASADTDMISGLKKALSIWNINSFAEFYMQIAEKYKKDYELGLSQLVESRKKLFDGLSSIEYIRPIKSYANYVMCEITGGKTSAEITQKLLNCNIFIKDLTSKVNDGKQYVRIAVRNDEDNQVLLERLKDM